MDCFSTATQRSPIVSVSHPPPGAVAALLRPPVLEAKGTSVRLRSQSLWSRDVRRPAPSRVQWRPRRGWPARPALTRDRRLAVGPETRPCPDQGWWDGCGTAVGDNHARRAMSLLALTSTVRRSVSFPSPGERAWPQSLHRGGKPAVVEVACHPQHAVWRPWESLRPFHA